MIDRMINYFRGQGTANSEFGIISLCVDTFVENNLSFRIDARMMQVDWGDEQKSECMQTTEQFTHQYHKPGIYHIIVRGEDITAIDMLCCNCTQLDVSECPSLEFINCSSNLLKELDLRNCKLLYELYCNNNQLTILELDKHRKLFYIACSFNKLSDINLKNCKNLVNLYCSQNQLQTLDVSHCHKLITINIEKNLFSEDTFLSFISTLRRKFRGTPGLLRIGNIHTCIDKKIRESIYNKGWWEI